MKCVPQETYYVPPLIEGPFQKISKGKLPDRYRNVRKALKKAGATAVPTKVQTSVDMPFESGFYLYLLVV